MLITHNSVSIIIPVYNGEKYLKECLESCLRQSYDDLDIVVVDDGSTDSSTNIAWEFAKDNRHITFVQKQNGGTGSALNVGIDNSHGHWIKWLSADDVLNDGAINTMMDYINHVDPGKRFDYLYYCDYEIIDQNSAFKSVFQEPNRNAMPQEMLAAELYYNFFGNGSTSMFSRMNWLKVGRFNENMPYNDDYEYWMRWVLKYKLPMHHIPFISTQYRVHSESLTGTKKPDENLKLVENLRRDYKQYLNEYQLKYLSEKKQKLTRRLAKKLPGPVLNGLMRLKK
ncbi:MAG: glycosyltransferase family 2 protein [Nitrosopumilus sp.]